jgi:hypothetical protein
MGVVKATKRVITRIGSRHHRKENHLMLRTKCWTERAFNDIGREELSDKDLVHMYDHRGGVHQHFVPNGDPKAATTKRNNKTIENCPPSLSSFNRRLDLSSFTCHCSERDASFFEKSQVCIRVDAFQVVLLPQHHLHLQAVISRIALYRLTQHHPSDRTHSALLHCHR